MAVAVDDHASTRSKAAEGTMTSPRMRRRAVRTSAALSLSVYWDGLCDCEPRMRGNDRGLHTSSRRRKRECRHSRPNSGATHTISAVMTITQTTLMIAPGRSMSVIR